MKKISPNLFFFNFLEAQHRPIRRFTTFIINRKTRVSSCQVATSIKNFHEALLIIATGIGKTNILKSFEEYGAFWGFMTDKEKQQGVVVD